MKREQQCQRERERERERKGRGRQDKGKRNRCRHTNTKRKADLAHKTIRVHWSATVGNTCSPVVPPPGGESADRMPGSVNIGNPAHAFRENTEIGHTQCVSVKEHRSKTAQTLKVFSMFDSAKKIAKTCTESEHRVFFFLPSALSLHNVIVVDIKLHRHSRAPVKMTQVLDYHCNITRICKSPRTMNNRSEKSNRTMKIS